MAYTNYTENLLNGLRTIIGTEFKSKPVILWGEQDKRPGPEYIELHLATTDPTDTTATRRGRLYNVRVEHVSKIKAYPEFKRLVVTGELIERIEQLLYDNLSYSPGGVYHWHDITFGTCNYEAATEEDQDDGYYRASLSVAFHIDKLNQ
jgi:hypothetical protein